VAQLAVADVHPNAQAQELLFKVPKFVSKEEEEVE
jgi:hypothetical protein